MIGRGNLEVEVFKHILNPVQQFLQYNIYLYPGQ